MLLINQPTCACGLACVITRAPIAWLEISPADEDTAGTHAGIAGPSGLLPLTQVGDGQNVQSKGKKAALVPLLSPNHAEDT